MEQKWPSHLLIVRHGESVRNVAKDAAKKGAEVHYFGSGLRDMDTELTARGHRQARGVGEYLAKHYRFDVLFTSPYLRTIETSEEIVSQLPDKPRIVREERIREIEFGVVDGLTSDGIRAKYNEEYARREREGKYWYRPPGGESRPDVALRVQSLLGTLTRDYGQKNVLVVCHSVVVLIFRRLLERWGEIEYLEVDREQDVGNCSLTTYDYDGEKNKLILNSYNKICYEDSEETQRKAATSPAFERYIGIDYSGAETPRSSLKGLRVYEADRLTAPQEVPPPPSQRKYWSRRGIAEWLVQILSEGPPMLVGIDHGFSFPLQYFEQHGLPLSWPLFLDDFQRHWPTDEAIYVDFVRDGLHGNGAARSGNPRWRRLTELRARTAKSVFHFDVQGSVAKSTHAGIPWLRYILQHVGGRAHFWPFDGWSVRPNRSVIAEVYPSLWSRTLPSAGRTPDQQDAFATAEWLRRADADGSLVRHLSPILEPQERKTAEIEGWILGVV